MHVKIQQKNHCVEHMWPANSAVLFMFRPITLKQLNSLTITDKLSWWSRDNASDGAICPGFDSWLLNKSIMLSIVYTRSECHLTIYL